MAREYRDTANKKIIWARIGMFVEVTNEQFEHFRNECNGEEIPKDLFELFKERGKIGGDSYVPEWSWDGDNTNMVYTEGELW